MVESSDFRVSKSLPWKGITQEEQENEELQPCTLEKGYLERWDACFNWKHWLILGLNVTMLDSQY